jgi:hypothetical protein
MGKDGPPGTAKKAAPALRSFASVFMHADAADAALMVLGPVGTMGDGLSTPVMLFITSRIFNDLGSGPDLLREFSSKINEVGTTGYKPSSPSPPLILAFNVDAVADVSSPSRLPERAEPPLPGARQLDHGVPR